MSSEFLFKAPPIESKLWPFCITVQLWKEERKSKLTTDLRLQNAENVNVPEEEI